MSGFAKGAAALTALMEFLNKILGFFEESDVERERREQREREEANRDLGEAEKEGRSGDTSKIEDIINS